MKIYELQVSCGRPAGKLTRIIKELPLPFFLTLIYDEILPDLLSLRIQFDRAVKVYPVKILYSFNYKKLFPAFETSPLTSA